MGHAWPALTPNIPDVSIPGKFRLTRIWEADVVLLLGKRLDHRYRYGGVFSDTAKIIQADPSPAEIGRNRGVAVGIEGDLGAVVEQITAAGKTSSASKEDIAPWVEQLNKDAAAWDFGVIALMTNLAARGLLNTQQKDPA